MDVTVEDKIRQRAYEIWMSAGTAERDPAADWLEAERAIMRETAMPAPKPFATKSSAAKRTAKAAAKPVAAASAPKTRAATASAAKPASVRKRTKTQA